MANVVFVAPYALDATTRFVNAVVGVPDTRVGLISTDPQEHFPDSVRDRLAGHWRLDDCLDPDQLAAGVARLGQHLGGVDRLLAILENLQVPLAEVRERLGIAGMGAQVAYRFRDKAAMKTVFEKTGIPCARHRRATTPGDALQFADECGLPFVVKPLAGAGREERSASRTGPSSTAGCRRPGCPATTPPCWRSSWLAPSTPSTAR